MNEDFNIVVGNQLYNGWQRVSVSRSMTSLAATFDIEVSDKWTPDLREWVFTPGDEIKIKIDNNLLLTGYIDEVNAEKNAESHFLRVTGRDKTADLVDCAASFEKVTHKNIDLYSLAKKIISDYDVDIVELAEVEDKKFDITFEPGETVFSILNRKCKELGCLLNSNRYGELVVTNASDARALSRLVMGQNIKSARFYQNNSDRFQLYYVRGFSNTQGTGWRKKKKVKTIQGTAIDPDIRYRAHVVQAEQAIDINGCNRQAEWEKSTRIGKSRALDVTVQGLYQTGTTEIWDINKNVFVDIPEFDIAEDLLIVDLAFSKSDAGTETAIKLMPKEAFIQP